MTEAMPFLQKAILLSYAPRPFVWGFFVYPRWIFWLPVDQTWGSWAAAGVF